MLYRTHIQPSLTVQLTGSGSVVLPNQHRAIYSSYINSQLSRSRNVRMNEMNNDIGYPQPNLLLNSRRNHSVSYSPNYLQMNIKKMSEYGPDTVKVTEYGLQQPSKEYNPARILSIKKQQNSLKASTKIVLNKELKVPIPKAQERKLKKLDAALQLNDRVLEIKQSYSNGSRRGSLGSASSQLHRFTESYMMKRSTTKKKKAYQQVFGEELGLTSMVNRPRQLRTADLSDLRDSKRLNRRGLKYNQRDRLNESTTLKFKKVINKLSSIDQVFDGKLDTRELEIQIERKAYAEQKSQRLNRTEQDQMLRDVRSFAQRDRQAKADKSYSRIGSLADLQKIDPQFCKEFRRHKEKKLIKMRCDLMLLDSMTMWQHAPTREVEEPQQSTQREEEGYIERPVSFRPPQDALSYRRMSRQERIMDFLRKFMRAKQSGDIFGIPNGLLYEGMYSKPQPYELEGSYLFFRAIEKKDMKTLRSMVGVQPRMLFQIDEDGRTPIIYAAYLNNLEICQLFITIGCNLDAFSYRYHTAIYYAIVNRNPELLFELLYHGASPWSHPRSNLTTLLEQAKNDKLTGMMQLSRRISIITRMLSYRLRPAAFFDNRDRLRTFLS